MYHKSKNPEDSIHRKYFPCRAEKKHDLSLVSILIQPYYSDVNYEARDTMKS
jgi:hypothetical protein